LRELRLEALRDHPLAFTADLAESESHALDYWRDLARRADGEGNELLLVAEARGELKAMAGVYTPKTLMDTDAELWERHIRINQFGCFLGMKAVVPAMHKTGGGSIVNISSVLGLRGASYAMAYCASKGAVRALTKNVALHCAQMKYGIRCNSVHPGYIDTPMIAPRLAGTIDNMSGRQWLETLHPLGRLGRAEEVANMILFLLSDESGFSTGSEFVCDGGLTA